MAEVACAVCGGVIGEDESAWVELDDGTLRIESLREVEDPARVERAWHAGCFGRG